MEAIFGLIGLMIAFVWFLAIAGVILFCIFFFPLLILKFLVGTLDWIFK